MTTQEATHITFPPLADLLCYYKPISPSLVKRLDEIRQQIEHLNAKWSVQREALYEEMKGGNNQDWDSIDRRSDDIRRESQALRELRDDLILKAIEQFHAPILQEWDKAMAPTGRAMYWDPQLNKKNPRWPIFEGEVQRHEDGTTTIRATSTYHLPSLTTNEEIGQTIMYAFHYPSACWESVPLEQEDK